MGRYVKLASDGNPMEPDGSLVAGGDVNDWYRMYCELSEARTTLDRHKLLALARGYRELLDDGALAPHEYVSNRGVPPDGRELDDPRTEQLNDMVDRYEGLVGQFLMDNGIEVNRG